MSIYNSDLNLRLRPQNFCVGGKNVFAKSHNRFSTRWQKYSTNVSRKSCFGEDFFLLYTIVVALLLGSICGAVIANCQNKISLDSLINSIEIFFGEKFFSCDMDLKRIFLYETVKNGMTILFLWLMAFVPLGKIFILLCLFVRGICYGFASSIIFDVYNLKGFWYILKFLVPSDFILIPVFIFDAFCSMFFAKTLNKNCSYTSLIHYLLMLALFLCLMFLSIAITLFIRKVST